MMTYFLVACAIALLLWPGKKTRVPTLIEHINVVPEQKAPIVINSTPSFRAAMDALHLVHQRFKTVGMTPEQRAAMDVIVLGLMQGIDDEQ